MWSRKREELRLTRRERVPRGSVHLSEVGELHHLVERQVQLKEVAEGLNDKSTHCRRTTKPFLHRESCAIVPDLDPSLSDQLGPLRDLENGQHRPWERVGGMGRKVG
jgi:hypothetical protein